jgi:hypothetical protein
LIRFNKPFLAKMSNRTPGPFDEKIEDVSAIVAVHKDTKRVYPTDAYMEWPYSGLKNKLGCRFGESQQSPSAVAPLSRGLAMKSRVLWLGIVLSFSLAALAQDTASITGTVTDPSGAAVSGAQVTLTSPDRGINRTSPTNESGDFLFGSVPSGSYDLVVVGAGFKKYQAKGVKLAVGQKARADVALQVGAANTTVEVEGVTVAQVETQSSDLSGTVTGKEITQLELNGRNFTQLATLVPGVSNQSGQDDASVGVGGNVSFSMNGGRTEYKTGNWTAATIWITAATPR